MTYPQIFEDIFLENISMPVDKKFFLKKELTFNSFLVGDMLDPGFLWVYNIDRYHKI